MKLKKLKNISKKSVYITLSVVAVVILGLYLSRGLIRVYFIPFVATRLYSSSINRVFNEKVHPINLQLNAIGIYPNDYNSSTESKVECRHQFFELFRETMGCSMDSIATIERISIKDAKWEKASNVIEKILLEKGWKIDEDDSNMSGGLDKIFLMQNFEGYATQGNLITYKLDDGKVTCSISFFASNPEDTKVPAELRVDEYCSRDLRLFGGYY